MRRLYRSQLTIGLFGAALSVLAQPTSYGRFPVTIKCGVLILSSTIGPGGQPTNADPYVFYNLDKRMDMKPAGWIFDNPNGTTTFSTGQAARWNAILGVNRFSAGQKMGKNFAAYWEVELDQVNSKSITNYDILMIHAPGAIRLSPLEREKLQAFIDSGGTLWFDKSASQVIDGLNSFPVPFATSAAGANPAVVQPFHPLLNYPYQIGYYEAAYMGAHRGTHSIIQATLASMGVGSYGDVFSTIEPDFFRFNQIVRNSNGMVVGVANMGAGLFVVTSGNITSRINEPAGGTNAGLGRNSGPVAGTDFLNIPITELKFMYNMIALSGGHPGLSKSSRRLGTTFDEIGAPLLDTWSDPTLNMNQGNPTNYFPPAVYKGLVFVVTQDRLLAYKADPSQDLDNDGWTDDGFQDASQGASADLVWQSTPLNAPISSPVCVEVSNPQGTPRDQVWVIDGRGRLVLFNAFPKNAGGFLQGAVPIGPVTQIDPPGATAVINNGANNRGPYTPATFEGVIYVYDAYQGAATINGRVWAVDAAAGTRLNTGGTDWQCAGPGAPNLAEPGGSATIGYIPISDGSGGLDAVMYVPNRSSTVGQPAGVTSLWIGARGEAPTLTRSATFVDCVTRAATKGLRIYQAAGSSLGLKVTLIDDNNGGAPLDAATTASYLDGTAVQFAPGQIKLGLFQSLPANISVRLDYRIDWGTGAANIVAQILRGQVFLPDDINRNRYTVKSMALAPNGNLFVITSNEFTNGTLFCINEFTRGQFRLVYRWDLYDSIRIQLNGTQTQTWGPALVDQDYLVTNMVPFLNTPMRRLHFHGNPAVINNVCYVSVAGEKQGFGGPRVTGILAFDANPTRTDVRLGGPIPAGFRMRQPDVAASTNKSAPERSVTLQPDQAELNTSNGTIRFNNMMSSTTGDMRNAFSTSLPVIVSGNGQPETILDPDATGSKWSPLLWYFIANGFVNDSPPLVMGNTIYEAGGSILPDLIAGTFPPRPRASLFAMDAEIPPNDPSILKIPNRPGLKQVRWLYPDATSPMGFKGNPHVRWPSGEGITTMNDFVIRLNQSLLGRGTSQQALGVVGGDGTVVAWADQGVFGFRKATTVVADEGRIIETDSAGFVQWTSDLTYQFAENGNTTLVQPIKLVRPTKVYKTAANVYTVVDTGGDRISLINKGAGETRSISKISLDTTFRPAGWQEGGELNLRQPRDVTVWGDYVPMANNRHTGPAAVGTEYWVHYLIADTGNRRLVELVDRYYATFDNNLQTFTIGDAVRDVNGDPQIGKLQWTTPQSFSGKTWQYTAIQRFQVGYDTTNPNAPATQFIYVAALGDVMPTRIGTGLDTPDPTGFRETGGGSGGIVIFDSTGGNQVINEINVNGTVKRLTAVNSVSVRPIGFVNNRVTYAVMFTDSSGVYEVVQNGTAWNTVWAMTNAAYRGVRGVQLRAVAAKRLSNGNVLITNAYFGKTDPIVGPPAVPARDFDGEVTQWDDQAFNWGQPNLGFTVSSIKFELPPVVGSRGLRSPQFADRL